MNFFKNKTKKSQKIDLPKPREAKDIAKEYTNTCFEVGQLEDACRRSKARLEFLYQKLESLYQESVARNQLDNEAKSKLEAELQAKEESELKARNTRGEQNVAQG